MSRYNMIKQCLHLPFSQSLAAEKSSASNFWSLAFAAFVGPQLLVFSATNHTSSTLSNQATQTDKQ
jgi:hypothetical protein